MAGLDTIATWLQREDEELLYEADRPGRRPAASPPTGAALAEMVLAEVHRQRSLGVSAARRMLALHPAWYAVLAAYCTELEAYVLREPPTRTREGGCQLYGVQMVPDGGVETYRWSGGDGREEAE